MIVTEPVVDCGLEDLDLSPRNLGTAQPPDKLLALPGKHASRDDLDPPLVWNVRDVHYWRLMSPWTIMRERGIPRFPY